MILGGSIFRVPGNAAVVHDPEIRNGIGYTAKFKRGHRRARASRNR